MKKLKVILIFMIIVINCNFCFANMGQMNQTNIQKDSFVYVSSEEVAINSEFYLIINLSKINYTKFNIKIVNSSQVELNDVPEGISNVSTNGNITSFNVNKNDIDLEKLAITYDALQQEGTINFDVTITSLDDNVTTWEKQISSLENEINELNSQLANLEEQLSQLETESDVVNVTNTEKTENSIEENEKNSEEELKKQIEIIKESISKKKNEISEFEEKIKNNVEEVLTQKITVKVVDTVNDKKILEQEDKKMENMMSTMKKMMGQVEKLEGNLKNANDKIDSLTTTATYQGSQNNYLKSLSISGVEFKSAFKKTTHTYFAIVDESVENVIINATAEDSSAIVTIYGNDNLVSGKNKILINVTADDGSCRTYKIYVIKQ